MLRSQKGQALLVVVLVMVVALTVGLSVASRSITNLKTSQDQASSQKALSAAEAGVERVLANPGLNPPANTAIGNTNYRINYTTNVSQVSGTGMFLFNGGMAIGENQYVYIWPSANSGTDLYGKTPPWSNGQITLYWGTDADGCNDPALEVSILSGTDKNNTVLTRYAYDPCASRAGNNGFDSKNTDVIKQQTTINNVRLQYLVKLPIVSNNVYLFSISPLYVDNSYIGASSNLALPPQGVSVISTGSVGDPTNGQVQRKVNAYESLHQIPAELFPYTIYSP